MNAKFNRWGLKGVFAPENVQARNEFSGEIDRMGVAAWQVTWTQKLLTGEDFEGAITALSKIVLNGVEFTDGADPVLAAPRKPVTGDPLAVNRPLAAGDL